MCRDHGRQGLRFFVFSAFGVSRDVSFFWFHQAREVPRASKGPLN